MDHHDEGRRAIGWAKGHDEIHPLNRIGPLESKFLLRFGRDGQLMIAHDGIVEPHPKTFKCIFNSIVAAGDWVGNKAGYLIQRDIVDTKVLDKVLDVSDVFLMGLGSRRALKSH
jgi:hypothetical protein